MKYLITMITLLVFTLPMAFASGGPSFEQLYEQTYKEKQVVQKIDKSIKQGDKLKICLKNVAQNKVETKPC